MPVLVLWRESVRNNHIFAVLRSGLAPGDRCSACTLLSHMSAVALSQLIARKPPEARWKRSTPLARLRGYVEMLD